MKFNPVLNKRDFAARYLKEEFGNRAPSWDNISEFLQSDYDKGLIHIRNRITGAATWYDIAPRNVAAVWESALREGYNPGDLYLSSMAPTKKTLIQGEIQQTPVGLCLYHTSVIKPMRQALIESSKHDSGIIVIELLKHFLDSPSYDWMETLLDRYPGHVLEFSTYSVCWGTIANRNTVWWEVRNY